MVSHLDSTDFLMEDAKIAEEQVTTRTRGDQLDRLVERMVRLAGGRIVLYEALIPQLREREAERREGKRTAG